MQRMGWQTVEHWQAVGEVFTYEVRLKQVVDDPFSTAWRVEWGTRGASYRGSSFTGDGREQRARDLLEERKASYKGDGTWAQIT